MIHGSRGSRAFLSASGIAPRLVVEASGFQPLRDGQTDNSRSSISAAFLKRLGTYLDPWIPPALVVDGHGWRREREVRERACGHCDDTGESVDPPNHGDTAIRAKAV